MHIVFAYHVTLLFCGSGRNAIGNISQPAVISQWVGKMDVVVFPDCVKCTLIKCLSPGTERNSAYGSNPV